MSTLTFDTWADDVADRLGYPIDGDLTEDGYSVDTFYDMYETGKFTPEAAADRVLGNVFIDDNGDIYRLMMVGTNRATNQYTEKWKIQTFDGVLLNWVTTDPHATTDLRLIWKRGT